MKATKEQQLAIDREGSNIIVSAGAGSGKTAVLSERVLRKVKENVDIRKLLVLTFTNEAAGEMKNRIREKIKEAQIKEQLEYVDTAYITTFDAYALSIVKKYHYLLNITKNISIVDSSIINLEKERILENIFLSLYEAKDKDFQKLVGDFTNRSDDIIKEGILNIKASLDLRYDSKEYLDTYIDKYYSEENIDNLFKEYYLYLKNKTLLIEDILAVLTDMLDSKLYEKVYNVYSKLTNIKCYNDLYKVKDLGKVQFRNIPEEAIEIKDNLKDLASEIMNLSKYSEDEFKEQLKSTLPYVRIIIKIINRLDEEILEYKNRRGVYEFLDIAKMAIKVVKENENIRWELKNNYNEILIDEYQDTNDLQEIFISLIENNNVYMVGDIKQSIYRFRNANPGIFKKKYEDYTKNNGGIKIDLIKNFRSRKEVLNNINEIFSFLISRDMGGVNYNEGHYMVYGNQGYELKSDYQEDYNMDILTYDVLDKKFKNSEIEAFIIAKDIKKKIANNYQILDMNNKKYRKALYSDFCIILDRGSDMPLYKKIFQYLNIPMDVFKDSNLTVSNDILIIKNIISLIILINKKESSTDFAYYFISIARSFLSDLTDEEIFKIKNTNSYYNIEIYQKCLKLAFQMEYKTPKTLLEEIIKEFNFYENLIKVGNIDDSITRINYLLDLAFNAEELGFTIEEFRDYLEEMIKNAQEIRYKENKESLNCVKIMNIHKSKGLQFPVCYYAGLTKDFNLKDLQTRFMFDKKYGILTPFYDEGIGTLFVKELIKNNYLKEEIAEKIRLFYVALTRAEEKIIMVAPSFKKTGKLKNPIDINMGLKFKSFYDFLEAMSLNLSKYIRLVDLKKINLTKDYEFVKKNSWDVKSTNELMEFRDIKLDSKLIKNRRASKTIKNIITKKEALTLEYGTKMHEMLEMTDFKNLEIRNKWVDNLRDTFDFKNALIYQELEFMYELDDVEYHGIIDLMLEYPLEIKIIDYKLKNIQDEEYQKQLEVYYNYIKSISSKEVNLYLYSIIDNKIKKLEPKNKVKITS